MNLQFPLSAAQLDQLAICFCLFSIHPGWLFRSRRKKHANACREIAKLLPRIQIAITEPLGAVLELVSAAIT
jgi:hypothetical protein